MRSTQPPSQLVYSCRCSHIALSWPFGQRRFLLSRVRWLPGAPALGEAGSSTWHIRKRSLHMNTPQFAPKKDPYAALGVAKTADKDEIKKAYYQLAKRYHPDTNKEAAAKERFVEIQDAFDTIGDEDRRKAYDRYGSAAQDPNFDAAAYERAASSFGGTGGFGANDYSGSGNFSDFFANARAHGGAAGGQGNAQDIFDSLFGAFGGARAGSARATRYQGEDVEVQMSITFEDAAKGTNRTITINPVVQHADCKGSGVRPGAKRQQCKTCSGTGTATFVVQGNFHMQTTCNACRGQGTIVPPDAVCSGCQGVGVIKERTVVPIEIPAGIEDGMRIRLPGRGDAPFEGKGSDGDLYVRISVGTSKLFRRQGANLFHDKTVPFHTAALGGPAVIPTLDEQVTVRLPAGTQQGEEMVLRGRGVRKLNSTARGDLTVRFSIAVPRSLSALQKGLLEQYRESVDGGSGSVARHPAPGVKRSSAATEAKVRTQFRTSTTENPADAASAEKLEQKDKGVLSRVWKEIKGIFDTS